MVEYDLGTPGLSGFVFPVSFLYLQDDQTEAGEEEYRSQNRFLCHHGS